MAINSLQDLLNQLIKWTNEKKFKEIEELWLEQLPNLPSKPAFYLNWLKVVAGQGAARKIVEPLMITLLEDRAKANKWRAAYRICVPAIRAFPHSDELRPLVLTILRNNFSDVEQIEEFIAQSKLEQGGPLAEGFAYVRDMTQMVPGQVHSHYDWGEGVVQSLDLTDRKVVLAFPDNPAKEMTIEGVRKFLKWVDPKSFLARRATEPDALREMAASDPIALIKLVLSGNKENSLKQAELKALLSPTVIDARSWNNWWSKAREGLKLDPFIDFDATGGARAQLKLRDTPRTFEEEIEEAFFDAEATPALKSELIRELGKRPKESKVPAALIRRMEQRLQEDWGLAMQASEPNPVLLVEIGYMLEDLDKAAPDINVQQHPYEDQIDRITDYRALFEIEFVDYANRALAWLVARDGEEGYQQAAELLHEAPVKMAQAIWRLLDDADHHEMAVTSLQHLLDDALNNPDTYIWAVKSILDGSWKNFEDYFPVAAIVPELLNEMENWHRIAQDSSNDREVQESAKRLLSRSRTLLQSNKFAYIGDAAEQMTRDNVQKMLRVITIHDAFNSMFKSGAERIVRIVRRDLAEEGEDSASSSVDIFYCTARSKLEKTWELREITSTRIPAVTKAIEEARAEGDLRENAGYQYAKEEQKNLRQQQETISTLLQQAVVVKSEDVKEGQISFGTRFTVLNVTRDQQETYTALGRWEADGDRNIMSIQAPMCQQFLGKKAGEEFEIKHTNGDTSIYRILGIENALATGEWEEEKAQVPATT